MNGRQVGMDWKGNVCRTSLLEWTAELGIRWDCDGGEQAKTGSANHPKPVNRTGRSVCLLACNSPMAARTCRSLSRMYRREARARLYVVHRLRTTHWPSRPPRSACRIGVSMLSGYASVIGNHQSALMRSPGLARGEKRQ